MCKAEKIEIVFNCILGVFSLVLAVFVVAYEYYAISQYSQTLPQAERAAFGVAMIILFIFGYLLAGIGAFALACFLFGLTWKMYRADKKDRKETFIPDTEKIRKLKNRCLIALIIFKAIAVAVSFLFVFAVFDTTHETVLSKIVYCVAFAVYTASLVLTIVNRKKITAQTKNLSM